MLNRFSNAVVLVGLLAAPLHAQVCSQPITLRGELTRAMTAAELDANFTDLRNVCTAIDGLAGVAGFTFPAPAAGFMRSDVAGIVSIAPIADADVPNSITVDHAGTATTATSATTATTASGASGTPTLCSVGDAARGVDASFNAAGCFTPSGGGGSITVAEADGTPSVANVTTINVNQANGLTLTDLGAGAVRIDSSATGAGWTRVTKATDQVKTSDTTLANDSALQFSMSSGTTYSVRGVIFYQTTSTADFQYTFAGPTGVKRILYRHIVPAGTSYQTIAVTQSTGTVVPATSASAGAGVVEFQAFVQATSTATFAFEWAQNTTDTLGSTVYSGSWIEYSTP